MREVEFRGKNIKTNKWVNGTYYQHEKVTLCPIGLTEEDIKQNELHLIVYGGFSDWNLPANLNCYEVIPETVGQYTGLKDKNGKKIYENDIVSVFRKEREITELAIVYWNKGYAAFLKEPLQNWEYTSWDEVEVVGNITDNPDLLSNER